MKEVVWRPTPLSFCGSQEAMIFLTSMALALLRSLCILLQPLSPLALRKGQEEEQSPSAAWKLSSEVCRQQPPTLLCVVFTCSLSKCRRAGGNLVYSWVPGCRSNTRSNPPLNKENKRQRDASSQCLQTGCHRALPGFRLSSEERVLDSTTLNPTAAGRITNSRLSWVI